MLRRVARGNCTPRRSQIPDLNVSAHPALIVRSPPDATMANEQIAVQPANLFALLTDQTRLSPCLRGLLLPGFHQSSHLFLALDITTLATGHSPRVGLSPTGFAASFAARGLTPPSECARQGAPKKCCVPPGRSMPPANAMAYLLTIFCKRGSVHSPANSWSE